MKSRTQLPQIKDRSTTTSIQIIPQISFALLSSLLPSLTSLSFVEHWPSRSTHFSAGTRTLVHHTFSVIKHGKLFFLSGCSLPFPTPNPSHPNIVRGGKVVNWLHTYDMRKSVSNTQYRKYILSVLICI